MNRARLLGAITALGLGAALLGHTTSAEAQTRPRKVYTIILLDGSGSMLSLAANLAGQQRTKWQEGITRAKSYVTSQKNDKEVRPPSDPNWDPNTATTIPGDPTYYPSASHCYAIWTFGGEASQQVFPVGSGWSCATDPIDNFTKDINGYDRVISALDGVVAPADAGVMTPLAGGLCKALDAVRFASSNDMSNQGDLDFRRSVIVESDGMENSTPDNDPTGCFNDAGVDSSGVYNPLLLDPANPGYMLWAGGLPAGSWQWKVYNMAFWNFPQKPTLGNEATKGMKQGWSFLDFWSDFYGSPDIGLYGAATVALNIDGLFDWIPATTPSPGGAPPPPPPPPSSSGTFPSSLQAFAKGMSKQSGGVYKAIRYTGDRPPGTVHNPPADVSDNGVVDVADWALVNSTAVYGRPTSDSTAVANCDINHDGWVNVRDRDLITASWGQHR